MTPAINRQEISDVKKELIRFAHEEFNNKKPHELRLIQIKPQTIMQKGTVLPNLIIKSLKQAAYAIYLDYFDEIRFYFFSPMGQSLGASTLPKTDKILKEMHGKGNTILRLPKVDPLLHVDVASIQLRTRFESLFHKIEQKMNMKITRQLPPVNAIMIQGLVPKVRFGVISDQQSLGMDTRLLNSPLGDILLLREMYPIITGISAEYEVIQWLGTFWAFGYVDKIATVEYIQKSESFNGDSPLIIKAIEWWNQIYAPFLNETFENAIKFSQSSIEWIMEVWNLPILRKNDFMMLIILWILKNGKNSIREYNQMTETSIKSSWIIHQLLEFLYKNQELWKKYNVQLESILKDQYTWWLYVILSIRLSLIYSLPLDQISIVNPPEHYKTINPKEIQQLLSTKQIAQLFDQIPKPFTQEYSHLINEMLVDFLLRKAYKIDAPKIMVGSKNEDTHFKITIQNESDWILYDVEFNFTWSPENRFTVRKIEDSASPIFDIKRSITAKIMPQNNGSGIIQLRVGFRDPIFHDRRAIMELWRINVELN